MPANNTNPSPSSKPSFKQRAANFWERVSEGLELSQLWQQFQSEARASYGLYSKEVDWEAIGKKKGIRRGFAAAKALFLAMLMKLSPARRVVLLASLVLILTSDVRYGSGTTSFSLNLSGLGIAGLFLLLALELADRVTMKRDLEIAREIQRWLMLESPPPVPGCEIAFATRPANTVAGDYYDVLQRLPRDSQPSDRWLLVVADVAGKSVPAALLMATFQASLQTLSAAAESLAELVDGVNRYASAHSLGGMRFTTAFVAELDTSSRELTYVNAGHNAPILRRAAGTCERLDIGGMPFGIDPAAKFETGKTQLAPGDYLLIFTDGLVEAVNDREEEYSDARLLGLFSQMPHESAAATLQSIMKSVDDFVGTARQHDDTTCFVLRVS
ncbi:MAG: serine/threonine-protein phosphatase [Acidobacteria bacterium]|nr:serine/threonine-protein phosphatase [Acidobacteriota bacterium]